MSKKAVKKVSKAKLKSNIITVPSADNNITTTAEIVVRNKASRKPKVSVIMPVYNVEKYLRQCMDSVVNQTLRDIEIICVDDGSTDGSLEILMEYAAHDSRITVLRQQNMRAGAARNAGLAIARGEYLSFLDSDDFFEPNMLQLLVAKITETRSDIVMCDCFLYNDAEKRDECVEWTLRSELVKRTFSCVNLPNDIFTLSNCWVWNRLYKHSFIKNNNIRFQNLGVANDTYFSCIATASAKKISVLDKRLIHYRTKQAKKQSVTSSEFRQRFPTDLLKCFYDIYVKLKKIRVYDIIKSSYLRVAVEHMYWSRNAFLDDENLYTQFCEFFAKHYGEVFDTNLPFDINELNRKYTVLRNILVDYGVFKEIPKRIFYVWGANEPKRPEVQKCINSWLKFLPYYEIAEINDDSVHYFNFKQELKDNRWFRTVYNRKMWAYVADYIRVKALYQNGGIYFDTDVSVVQNMDKFLSDPAFVGMQMSSIDGKSDWVEPAICGAQKGNKFFKQIVEFYKESIWTEPIYTMPHIFNHFLRKYDIFPFPAKAEQKIINLPDITVYPERYFIPYRFRDTYTDDCIEPDTHTIHWWGGSWVKPDVLYFLQNKSLLADADKGIKFSVVVPVYNVEKFLPQCLDSVLNQTLKNIEIICINDGSTDESLKILKQYAKKDKRIKIINQRNHGLATSRNNALKIVKGEYIDFLDSDDFLNENALELLYNQAKLYNLDMLSFSGNNFLDGTDDMRPNPYWQFSYLPDGFNTNVFSVKDCWDFLHKMAVSSCLTVYKHDFIKKNKLTFPDGLCYEDNVFFTTAITKAKRCGILKSQLYCRRVHNASITKNWVSNFSDWIEIVDRVLKYLKSAKVPEKAFDNVRFERCADIKDRYKKLPLNKKGKYITKVKKLLDKYDFDYDKSELSKVGNISAYLLFVWYWIMLRVARRKYKKLKNTKPSFRDRMRLRSHRGILDAINNNHTAVMRAVSDINKRCDNLQRQIDGIKGAVVSEICKVVSDNYTALVAGNSELQKSLTAEIAKTLNKANINNLINTAQSGLRDDVFGLGEKIDNLGDDIANYNKSVKLSMNNTRVAVRNSVSDLKKGIAEINTKIDNSRKNR